MYLVGQKALTMGRKSFGGGRKTTFGGGFTRSRKVGSKPKRFGGNSKPKKKNTNDIWYVGNLKHKPSRFGPTSFPTTGKWIPLIYMTYSKNDFFRLQCNGFGR